MGESSMSTPPTDGSVPRELRRFLPIAALLLGLVLFFALRLQRYVTLDSLKSHRAALVTYVAAHPFLSAECFAGLYTLLVACSVPISGVLTIAGGFLFGVIEGSVLVFLAATLGATILFLAAKTAFAEVIRARFGARFAAMEDGFRHNAFSYLLVLRLVPIFPFFLVNLGAGVLGVRARTYVVATALGIIPGTVVYAGLGDGLGAIFDAGGAPDLHLIFAPRILMPLLGLALLALLPVFLRRTPRGI
jgi:uncharacterized membrane protein YdjX (TVP38/TMEM64 family)